MKLYLDTSGPTITLRLDDKVYEWRSERQLAKGLLTFIHQSLAENDWDWQDITSITFFSGPGSFTGLRIGATVVNTLADQLQIPLYDHFGQQQPFIIPNYGHPANITSPKA